MCHRASLVDLLTRYYGFKINVYVLFTGIYLVLLTSQSTVLSFTLDQLIFCIYF